VTSTAAVTYRHGVRELSLETLRHLAWLGGFLYLVTGVSAFILAIPSSSHLEHPTAVVVVSAVASVLGLVSMIGARAFADQTVERIFPFIAYVELFLPGPAITLVIYLAGPAFAVGALVYLVAPIFGVYLFSRRVAIVQIAAIGVEYAVLLTVQRQVTVPAAQWAFLMAMTGATAVLTGRFIDEADQLAASEREARLELAEANRQKSAFLAAMSHELRTPLNAIIGFSEVLHDRLFGDLNEKQDEYVSDVVSSGQHLLALINDILDLSKVEAGHMELAVGPVEVAGLVESAVAFIRPEAARSGITLRIELDPLAGVIEADQQRLRQVLINLLANAVKFTPDSGTVTISSSRSDGRVVMAVSDTGPGIAPADQDRIFEEFAQATPAVGGRQPGTGLGLTLARRFTELHDGQLTVDSDWGHGATFRVEVPA
jgi:signal transduction histidine kinase